MEAKELLLSALDYYSIPLVAVNNSIITVYKNYEIEIEANGLYKLKCEGSVIAPFDDVDELCRFMLL